MRLTLRQRVLDAVIDGKLGKGIIITRAQLMKYFKDENPLTVSSFLANSEMGAKKRYGAANKPFAIRVEEGKYQIHPDSIKERMEERATPQAA